MPFITPEEYKARKEHFLNLEIESFRIALNKFSKGNRAYRHVSRRVKELLLAEGKQALCIDFDISGFIDDYMSKYNEDKGLSYDELNQIFNETSEKTINYYFQYLEGKTYIDTKYLKYDIGGFPSVDIIYNIEDRMDDLFNLKNSKYYNPESYLIIMLKELHKLHKDIANDVIYSLVESYYFEAKINLMEDEDRLMTLDEDDERVSSIKESIDDTHANINLISQFEAYMLTNYKPLAKKSRPTLVKEQREQSSNVSSTTDLEDFIAGINTALPKNELSEQLSELDDYIKLEYNKEHKILGHSILNELKKDIIEISKDRNLKYNAAFALLIYESKLLKPSMKPSSFRQWTKVYFPMLKKKTPTYRRGGLNEAKEELLNARIYFNELIED